MTLTIDVPAPVRVPKASAIDGLLPIHKPEGMVSKDVSRWLTRRLGKLKLGHVGTLDPGASGVLPILLGRATRLQDWLLEMPKTYAFQMTFGKETTTLDLDGELCREAPWEHVTQAALEAAAASFVGDIEQTPPLYSAVKFKGKPLYEYARKNREGELPTLDELKRRVRIHKLHVLSLDGAVAELEVTCSKGTYVRTLVKDLAENLGTCATLSRLVRTEAAGVTLERAYTLEALEPRLAELGSLVVPLSGINLGIMRWQARHKGESSRLRSGQLLAVDAAGFLEGLGEPAGVDPSLTAWDKTALLLSESGQVIGIGAIRSPEPGRVVIAMKRGL